MAHSTNLVLEALPASEREILSPLRRPITLRQDDILFETQQLMELVYFPFDAVVSLVVTLSSGEMIETANQELIFYDKHSIDPATGP